MATTRIMPLHIGKGRTENYLTEHNLLEHAVLEEKAATAHHNELSAKIKAAEKHMAEIAVLRTHIINYAKTRDTYEAYRKAGYSKRFLQEHEEEILLHQRPKMPLTIWGSRSCSRSRSYKPSMPGSWRKRKRPIPSIGAPVKKCGSCWRQRPMWIGS